MRFAIVFLCASGLTVQPSSSALSISADVFDGDPVSLSTGLYVRTDDDLSVEDGSLTLTRTYRTRDDRLRPFGIGVSHSYNLYLVGDSETFQWADLVLEDGGRIHFRRIMPGTALTNAVYEHRESPTAFYGSRLQWNGAGWTIDLRDGARYTFSACNPRGNDFCHLLARRDPSGHEVHLDYDASGDLQRINGAGGGWIAFTHAAHRIVLARASTGATVQYAYDAAGRLVRVATSRGRLQEYTYGRRNEVRSIREPDRLIENTYDAELRCVKQVVTFGERGQAPRGRPDVFAFAYRLNPQGKIIETTVVQPDGTVRVATFNVNGYLVTDTSDRGGPRFTEVVYARDERTNLAPRVTVRCAARGKIVEAVAAVGEHEHPDTVRGRLIAQTCR